MKVENFRSVKGVISLRFSLVVLALLLFQYGSAIAAVGGVGSLTESLSSSVQDERAVSGVVTDASGEPLIAVSVVVKGTTIGTATDFDGNFHLVLPEGNDELEFLYLGFKPEIINVAGKAKISVVMHEDTQALDELVVTALGIKRSEKALSYNVQTVGQDDLTKVKDASFVSSLNGKVAGLTMSSSASVGTANRVVLRGTKSLSAGNGVLYVIDGMPLGNPSAGQQDQDFGGMVGGEAISDLNPEDIESISVLSGPSAAALYGNSAANGVILINTKKGKEGKMQVSISNNTEFMTPLMLPRFQNTYGNKPGQYGSWGAKLDKPSNFNPREFFNTGLSFINSANISFGDKKNQTYISMASTNSKGIMPSNKYDRYNVSFRNSASLLNDKLRVDVSASYIKQSDLNMLGSGQYLNPLVPLYLFPRGEDFEAVKYFEHYNEDRGINTQNWAYGNLNLRAQNPYWIVNRNLVSNKKDRYMFYVNAVYDITDWLNVSGRARIDNTTGVSETKYFASTDELFAPSPTGYYGNNKLDYRQKYADLIFNLNKNIGDFSLAGNTGVIYEGYVQTIDAVQGGLGRVPNLFSFGNIRTASVNQQRPDAGENIALFGSAEIGYKSMLYLSLTERIEWDSHLVNTENPYYHYPSVGLSSVITEMVSLPTFVDYLKIRGSYTKVGSPIKEIGKTPGTITYDVVGGEPATTSIYPFPKFKPENTQSYELGLNSKFFKNRLSVDLTLYHSNTYNQTFLAKPSPASGYTGFYIQAGDVMNRGIELAIGLNNQFGDFYHSSNLTYTLNDNKIMKLVENYENPVDGGLISISEMKLGDRHFVRQGGKMGDVYVNQTLKEDYQGNIIITNEGEIALQEKQIKVGSTDANFSMGWKNDFSYKGFNLGLLITGRFGGIVTSATEALLDQYGVSEQSAIARDNGGVMLNNKLYDAEKYYKTVGTDGMMAYYVYDATNIRLQELSLSYTFPKRTLANLMDLTLSLTGKNLLMIYNKAPFDPQLTSSTGTFGQGHDYFMPPSLRSLGFSVKMNF